MLIELLLGVVIALLLVCAGLLGWIVRRSGHDALLRVTARLEALRESQERITRAVVDELGFARREAAQAAEEQRSRLGRDLAELRNAFLDGLAEDTELRKSQLLEVAERLAQRADAAQQQLLQAVRHDVRGAQEASATLLGEHQLELEERLGELRASTALWTERDAEQTLAASEVREGFAGLRRALTGWLGDADARLASATAQGACDTERVQGELARALEALRACFEDSASRLGEAQSRERGALATAVESALGSFHDDHTRRLERIRHAVEERLPATLDQRLSDSFHPASLRLDEIRRLLEELRALAARPGALLS